MINPQMDKNFLLNRILRAARPGYLLGGTLFYIIGVGIAPYQGYDIHWIRFGLGLVAVLLLQLSMYFLKGFFDEAETPVAKRNELIPRQFFLIATMIGLTGGAVMSLLLIQQGGLSPAAYLVIGLGLLIVLLYAIPPFRLVYTAYGELAHAILLVNLIPGFGSLIQTGEIYRILPAVTFPLTVLFLAMTLAHAFPDYAADIAQGKNRNILHRIGWENAVSLHNVLLLVAYLMMGGVSLLGLPWGIFGPGFLTLPLALFQIWQILRVASGKAVRWRLLVVTSVGTLAITAYLFALRLWTW